MIENVNIKQNPFTTIIGTILFLIGLITLLLPMFIELREDLPMIVKWLFLGAGFGLLLAPDTIIKVFVKVADKKSDTL